MPLAPAQLESHYTTAVETHRAMAGLLTICLGESALRGLTTNGPRNLLLPRRRHHGGGANRRPAAVGDRASARRRHSHQLFRPGEHLGRGAPAPAGVRPDAGRSRIAVQRLLLVVRHSADPRGDRARQAWGYVSEPRLSR